MRTIGIDIGTTTLSIALLEPGAGKVIEVKTVANTSSIESENPYERIQDPEIILRLCKELLHEIAGTHTLDQVNGIGVTGQMHGIVYLDSGGDAVSPLFTWQDERGNQLLDGDAEEQGQGLSYATLAGQKTDYPLASGFGSITHFYNTVKGLIPKEAACFCTIADYIGMKLSGNSKPLLHPSMAASLGLYDLKRKCFDEEAINKLGMDFSFFPETSHDECLIGSTDEGIAVSIALGDNQASFLGATAYMTLSSTSKAEPSEYEAGYSKDTAESLRDKTETSKDKTESSKDNTESSKDKTESLKPSILLNIGTGGQISIYSENLGEAKGGEYRPYLKDSFIWAGSPLCSGYSYSLLKDFFEKTLELFGATPTVDLYQGMNQAGESLYKGSCEYSKTTSLKVDTRFRGTRTDPRRRGSITNIAEEELQPDYFILGFLKGIAGELYEFYQSFLHSDPSFAKDSYALIGSGNGLRKNPLLRRICSDIFGKELKLSSVPEEAACGSAYLAFMLCREREAVSDYFNETTRQKKSPTSTCGVG
jgi:sedoheptulokinase